MFGIPQLIEQVEAAHNEGRYLFIWDKSEQIDTFFKYKGFLCDFYFQHMKVTSNKATPAEACEALRDQMIKAGR